MEPIKLIVHCSDSSWGNAAIITTWHVLERKWKNIGYHYVILNGRISAYRRNGSFDGQIETGRPLDDDGDITSDEFGAHAVGYNNCIGICLIGLSGTFTEAQIRSLKQLVRKLKAQFIERGVKVIQHSDVEPKKPHCAGLDDITMGILNTLL